MVRRHSAGQRAGVEFCPILSRLVTLRPTVAELSVSIVPCVREPPGLLAVLRLSESPPHLIHCSVKSHLSMISSLLLLVVCLVAGWQAPRRQRRLFTCHRAQGVSL